MVDSSATNHMSGNKDNFSSLTFSDALPDITIADGNVTVMTLDSVLYVPKSPFSLISISQITEAFSCSITFTPTCIFMQDLGTGRTIGEGHESHGHYYLDGCGLQ